MTKEEAIIAMGNGYLVTHSLFSDDEYITLITGTNIIIDEKGYETFSKEWFSYRTDKAFDNNWNIYRKPIIIEILEEKYKYIFPNNVPENIQMIDRFMYPFTVKPIFTNTTISTSDIDEYEAILRKTSNLSVINCKFIINLFNKNFKKL